jgi:hypothetical protein
VVHEDVGSVEFSFVLESVSGCSWVRLTLRSQNCGQPQTPSCVLSRGHSHFLQPIFGASDLAIAVVTGSTDESLYYRRL